MTTPMSSGPDPADASSLPRPLSPIVDREGELAMLARLLRRDDVRLVTLTGPGGVGKTRLAIEVAHRLGEEAIFSDGVRFVSLAAVREPGLVAGEIAAALGLPGEAGGQTAERRLVVALRHSELLLVLDNLEQVAAAAPVLADLLDAAPGLRILATSREPLDVYGGRMVRLDPLAVPLPDRVVSVAEALEFPAVRLFVERASASDAGFELHAGNLRDVLAICRRLDGLPLAIELACARIPYLSPAAMLDGLTGGGIRSDSTGPSGSVLALLGNGPRSYPERHRTLTDAIAWSYDLLTPAEQVLFRRLSVFAGGFSLDAAAAVGSVELPVPRVNGRPGSGVATLSLAVLDRVACLAAKSLLQPAGRDGPPRFAMLETLREYGLGLLMALGEHDDARRRHAAWCLTLVERAAPNPFSSLLYDARGEALLDELDLEHDNLRDALAWTIVEGDAAGALRLAGTLSDFWYLGRHLTEGRLWLERALALPGGPDPFRVKALAGATLLASVQGDHAAALDLGTRALALARSIDDPWAIAEASVMLGNAYQNQGRYADALPLHQEALAWFRAQGDRSWARSVLHNLAIVHLGLGELDQAFALAEESLALARSVGDRWGLVRVLATLSELDAETGELARAATHLAEGLAVARERNDGWAVADALAGVANLAHLSGDHERAARLLGAADARYATLGIGVPPPDHFRHASVSGAVRDRLGRAAFEAAHAAGRTLPEDELMVEAEAAIAEARASERPIAGVPALVAPPVRPPAAAGRTGNDRGGDGAVAPAIRVLLVDDYALFRQALAFTLDRESGLTVVAEVGTLAEARAALAEADVLLVAPALPDGDGVDLVREAAARRPRCPALILPSEAPPGQVARAIEAGAVGIVDPASDVGEVVALVRRARRGEVILAPWEQVEWLRRAGLEREKGIASEAARQRLTKRELDVIRALADGLSDREIAERLNISHQTVRTHMVNINRKLEVDSRLEVVLFAIRYGLIER